MITCCVCHHTNRPQAKFCANCRAPLLLQGKYKIAQLLGRGGFGAVYRAEQIHLGGAVCAIKELLPDPHATLPEIQQAATQFQLEARMLAELSHPALPKVTDFFFEGNRYYLAMEFVPGETLEERLKRNVTPLPEAQVITWMEALCDVLTYLHMRQPAIIHRDVKPSNIKITPSGELKLLDFGIAKMLSAGTSTATAARAVSAPFSPLEQYGKGKGTNTTSDIYATGVTMYRLLTNHLPPEAPDRANEAVTPPRQLNPNLSPNIEAVILRAIAEKQTDRFQNAGELKRAMSGAMPTYPQPASAPHPSSVMPVQPPQFSQHPSGYVQPATNSKSPAVSGVLVGVGAAIGLLLLVAIVTGLFVIGSQETAKQQATATAQVQATLIAHANSTATAQAQATMTAEANATATARVQATMTAEANATATAQARATMAQASLAATAQAIARSTGMAQDNAMAMARATQTAQANATASARASATLYGPFAGNLTHLANNNIPTKFANISVRDFVAEVRFFNPYERSLRRWDYGMGFRNTGSNQDFRIAIDSDGDWFLFLRDGSVGGGSVSPNGRLDNLDTSRNGSNLLRIEVKGSTGSFWVNGKFISTLDISRKMVAGDVWVGTSFFDGNTIKDEVTKYDGFTIWANP